MTAMDEATQVVEAPVRRESSAAAVIGLTAITVLTLAGVFASWWLFARPASQINPDLAAKWPFVVLALGVGAVITLIAVVGLHPFLALILAAIVAGMVARVGTLPQVDPGKPKAHFLNAIDQTAFEFGKTTYSIGIVIVLAAVIGMALLESGAADRVVRTFLRVFGEKRAGLALLLSTYVVSIPIFFDTIFMLLIPLARALALRTGKNYLLYVMAICCAGVITHSMVIPHPGPLAMVDSLGLDAGLSIFVGLICGLVPLAVGWMYCVFIDRRMNLPLTPAPGASVEELKALMNKGEEELPSFWVSILPVILPVFLIWVGSFLALVLRGNASMQGVIAFGAFIGERHVALFIGTVIALAVLMRQRGMSLKGIANLVGPPLETAGVIILITAAGGAFGAMLRNAGVGGAIKTAFEGTPVNLIVLSYVVAGVIRIAQGSATVAMLTTAGMMAPMLSGPGATLPYHPIYIFLAIGWGAMICSWMNDSGFWVVSRLGGLTEKQTLRSWTVLLTIVSVTGLVSTVLIAKVLPFAPAAAVVAP